MRSGFLFKQERCKDEKLQFKYACADQPSAPGCRTDGAINRCMGSVSATSGPDTELQVPDEILQNFGMKTSFSKDVPKLSINKTVHGQSTKIFKCGGIREHKSPRAGTPQGVYPVTVGQAKIQLTGHQRLISSASPVKSGVQRTHDEQVPPRNSTVLSQIELVCVQREKA